jgi:hypothetical protein
MLPYSYPAEQRVVLVPRSRTLQGPADIYTTAQ